MGEYLGRLIKNDEGYGTVELLLIVAGVGLLSTGLFKNLQNKLVGGDSSTDSTTDKVVDGIDKLLDGWLEGIE